MIVRKMEKRFGKIRSIDDGPHAMILFPMESNLLKVHRKNPEANTRRLFEAICLVLHMVDDYLEEKKTDVEQFETEENIQLRDALLMAFDPFTNADVNDAMCMGWDIDLGDADNLEEYMKLPVQCILWINDSAERWVKKNGSDGYFRFLENWMGQKVDHDDVMNYALLVKGELISGDDS